MQALLAHFMQICLALNSYIFAYIRKRAKAQKKNPWKEEIFTDTRDYIEAMDLHKQYL